MDGGFGALLGLVCAFALSTEFEDGRVVDDAIDGGGSRHRILEDPIPLAESEIAGDEQRRRRSYRSAIKVKRTSTSSALPLHAANVVEDEQPEGVELLNSPRQREITFRGE